MAGGVKTKKIDYVKGIIDDREHELMRMFDKRRGGSVVMEYESRRLDIADIVISDKIGIERKGGPDLPSSITDNRLPDQLSRLKEVYEVPILMIEGLNAQVFKETGVNINSIYGYLAKLACKREISVFLTVDLEHTAIAIERLAYREQIKKTSSVIARSCPKKATLMEQRVFLIEGLLNCGDKTAKILIDMLGTPANVIKAIEQTKVLYTSTGREKGIEGILKQVRIRGIGPQFILQNKKLLFSQEISPNIVSKLTKQKVQKTLI